MTSPEKTPSTKKHTASGRAYIRSSQRNLTLFNFVIDTILAGDFVAHVAQMALDEKPASRDVTPTTLAATKPGARTIRLREYSQELLEGFYARALDNFSVYLSDILREVLQKQPAILKNSQQTIAVDQILQFHTMEEFVQDLIESKIDSLSYKGFDILKKWFIDRGIPLSIESKDHSSIVECIATRNLIVHNRSKVDAKYLRMTDSKFKLNDIRTLNVDETFKMLGILNTTVDKSDDAIAAKFGLAQDI